MKVRTVHKVRLVRTVGLIPLVFLLALVGCAREPESWRDLREQLQSGSGEERAAAVEKFIAARGGTPIIENQTRLVFFAKDKDGQAPRIVGDFNAWAVTPQGYDASIGKPTRIEGTPWSYLESTLVHQRPAGVRVLLRQGGGARSDERAYRAGLRGPAF